MSPALAFLIFSSLTSIDENFCKASPVIAPTITNAPENAYPFVVSIQVKRGIKMSRTHSRFVHYCGGSLITRKHVLTAAHCFGLNYPSTSYRVLVGSNDLQSAKVYYIQSWLTYDNWAINNNVMAKYQENDIAVVELISSLSGVGINLAKITTASNNELRNQQVLSAGWGEISDGTIPRYMVEVRLTMISRETCLQNIKDARENPTDEPDTLDGNIFCTNGDPYAVLFCGDSGSPVFWKGNEIIGINECICPIARNGSLTKKEQNIHVDVRLYSDFISAVNDNCTIEDSTSVSRCWIM